MLGFLTPSLAAEHDDLHPLLESSFSLDLGIFFPDRKIDLRVNGTAQTQNEEFDFDEGVRLGNPDHIFATELAWRLRGRWSLRMQYFDSSDTSRTTLDDDIQWQDVVFGAGTGAALGTSLTVTRIFVGRSLDTERHHKVGFGGGIHWLDIGAVIDGTIVVDGNSQSARRSVSADGPVPNIGAWYTRSLSPRWAFRGRLDVLSLSVGDYSGLLLNTGAGFNYQAFENVGIGVAYNYFLTDFKIDRPSWNGDFETRFNGLYVSASAYF